MAQGPAHAPRVEALQQAASRAQGFLESSMTHAEAAEAMGMADALLARWQHLNARVVELHWPTAWRGVAMAPVTRSTRRPGARL